MRSISPSPAPPRARDRAADHVRRVTQVRHVTLAARPCIRTRTRTRTLTHRRSLATLAALAALVVPLAGGGAQATGARAVPPAHAHTLQVVGGELAPLGARLLARIAATPGAEVGLAVRDLASGGGLDIAGAAEFHAASTMKVPVLIQLWRDIEAGRRATTDRVPLTNRFASIVDGSPYALDAGEDSDSLVYTWVGDSVSLLALADRMITHSSNLATNVLVPLLDPYRITRTATALGAPHTRVLRGVEDGPAYRAGRNNVTTAADLAALLYAIETGHAASPAGTVAMRQLLLAQAFNDEIPAGLPAGTPVAHKTGVITATLHDAAIVYPPGRAPFVLVVLTRGIEDQAVARRLIADLASLVWDVLGAPSARQ